jgi:hypothetical protein
LDIPETISLNLLIFGSVNLNDEENNAVFKSVQTFIIKSKRFTQTCENYLYIEGEKKPKTYVSM